MGAVTGGSGGGGGFLVFCGLGMFFFAASRKHGLVIKTASGDVRAMESKDSNALVKVKAAIERAATIRG